MQNFWIRPNQLLKNSLIKFSNIILTMLFMKSCRWKRYWYLITTTAALIKRSLSFLACCPKFSTNTWMYSYVTFKIHFETTSTVFNNLIIKVFTNDIYIIYCSLNNKHVIINFKTPNIRIMASKIKIENMPFVFWPLIETKCDISSCFSY